MQPDMIVSWDKHLKNGNIWRVSIELPMQDAPEDAPQWLDVAVDVVAPTQQLATYIVTTMYPDYESLSVSERPLSA
jgi:hypothetical protein